MKNKFRHRNHKGEKMSLRKITTLLLLAAFALTQVPVQAANLTVTGTSPTVIVDAGTAANGANRDVVPVTLAINTDGANEVRFGTYTTNGTFAVTENGQLTTGGATLSGSTRVLVIEPPLGAEFVGLAGYNGTVTTGLLNPTATTTETLVNVTSTNLPAATNADTAMLAKIITEAGPASTFGTAIPVGSIVLYTITNTASNTTTGESDITFDNIGLAVPAGSALTTFNATYKEVIDGVAVNEVVPALADGATIAVATLGAAGTSQIAVALAVETDGQSNSVLADLLLSGSSTVVVSPNAETTTTVDAAILYVDTDALLIQAAEISTGVYFETPFNTSSFLSSVVNGDNYATLNDDLDTHANSANALITVTYSLVGLDGGATDATLLVNAASVSLNTDALGAFSTTPVVNGSTAISAGDSEDLGLAVLYGASSAALATVDFQPILNADDDVATDATSFAYVPTAAAVASASALNSFTVVAGTEETGIFSGVTVAQIDATNLSDTVVSANGTLVSVPGFTAVNTETYFVTDEVTARLLPTGGNAIFGIFGNAAGATLLGPQVRVGPTNLATVPYNTGASIQDTLVDRSIANNAIAAARLTIIGDNPTVQILPFVNKLNTVTRDIIKVRPEATITLTTASKAAGVKLIATVTGNNIVESQVVEIARINAAGSLNSDLSVSTLPVNAAGTGFLVENCTDATEARAAVLFSSITANGITENVTVGTVLDTTIPPFFCGGTAGNSKNGPNAVPNQPFTRAFVVEENTVAAFDDVIVGAGNDVIRFTMPAGVDLVKTDAAYPGTNPFTVISTDATGFDSAPAIVDIKTISETGSQAYIDVSVPAAAAVPATYRRSIGFSVDAKAIVVPSGTADLTVTASLVVGNIVLDTIGTSQIADSCTETQFTVAYCDDTLSTFANPTGPLVNDSVESALITAGAQENAFEVPGSGVRVVDTGAPTVSAAFLPDICITEAVPGALFGGDGVANPNLQTSGVLVVAIDDVLNNNNIARNIGFDNAVTPSVTRSDDSIDTLAASVENFLTTDTNGVVQISYLINNNNADSMSTTLRLSGVVLDGVAAAFIPAAQDLRVFTADSTTSRSVGNFFPFSYLKDGANGTAFSANGIGAAADLDVTTFLNGDTFVAAETAVVTTILDSVNGNLAFSNSGAARLAGAVTAVTSTNFSRLDALDIDEDVSIAVDEIAAVTNGLDAFTRITVFTAIGDLEPGSLITVSTDIDSVTVPVNSNGNFVAILRGEQGESLIIEQFPTGGTLSTLANNQNLTPTLLSAVATDLAFGTITAKGDVPVLFTITAVGRDSNGDTFMPTASQLKVGVNTVYAVPGTTNKFLSVVNFFKTNGKTVTATVDGTETSVVITGLTTDFPSLGGRPVLRKVKANKSETKVQFKGRRLRNNGFGYFVLSDGTTQTITFRKRNKTDSQKSRVVSDTGVTIPSNARYAVYHTTGRGISSLDISN